jgi:hypothetical protein
MQLSYWERESFFSNIDIVIIGSGIVGLNAALHLKLKTPLLNILVLERGVLPYGASTRNAGFACFGSVSELLDDLSKHEENEVFALVERRWKGLQRLRQNLGDSAIDYLNLGGYELFTANDTNLYNDCADKLAYLNQRIGSIIGQSDVYHQADEKIPEFGFVHTQHLIRNSAEAQIDTGKMMKALLSKVQSLGVTIINGIAVTRWEEKSDCIEIYTNQGIHFKAAKLLAATNAFAKELLPNLAITPGRAQVLITQPIAGLKIKGTFHYQQGYYYFRNIGNRLLFGGGRNLDFKREETTEFALTPLVQNELERLLETVILPNTRYSIDMRWSGIMGMGDKKTNIIEQLSPRTFCAIRCGGMGVAIGSLLGEEAAELVLNS